MFNKAKNPHIIIGHSVLIATILLLMFWVASGSVFGQTFNFDTIYDLHYKITINGGWGPGAVPVRQVLVSPSYKSTRVAEGRCCKDVLFLNTHSGRSAWGLGYNYEHNAEFGLNGQPAILQGYMAQNQASDPASAVSKLYVKLAVIPGRNPSTQLRLEQLRGTVLDTGRSTGKFGTIHLRLDPNFSMHAKAVPPNSRGTSEHKKVDVDLKHFYLLDYRVALDRKYAKILEYYQVVVEYPQGSRKKRQDIISFYQKQFFSFLIDQGAYVFQTFLNFKNSNGLMDLEKLGKIRIALFKRDWDFTNNICYDDRCQHTAWQSLNLSTTLAHYARQYDTLEPVMPARISFALHNARTAGQDMRLKIKAVRRTDGKSIEGQLVRRMFQEHSSLAAYTTGSNSYGKERMYLVLDDVPGTVYDIQLRLLYNGREYKMVSGGPLQTIERQSKPDNSTSYVKESWQTENTAWTMYTVGQPLQGNILKSNRDVFVHYDVRAQKPASIKTNINLRLADPKIPLKIKAWVTRLRDKHKINGFSVAGRGTMIGIEDQKNEVYRIDFNLLDRKNKIIAGQKPNRKIRYQISGIKDLRSGQVFDIRNKKWSRVTIGSRNNLQFEILVKDRRSKP